MTLSAAVSPVRVSVDPAPAVLRAGLLVVLGRYPERVRLLNPGGGEAADVVVRVASPRGGHEQERWRNGVPVLTLTWADGVSDGPARTPGTTIPLTASPDALMSAIAAASAIAAGGPRRRRASDTRSDGLSPREREVLSLICRGMSNKEMARHLTLSVNSVKTHVRLAYLKMGVANRSRAVLWGLEHGYGVTGP